MKNYFFQLKIFKSVCVFLNFQKGKGLVLKPLWQGLCVFLSFQKGKFLTLKSLWQGLCVFLSFQKASQLALKSLCVCWLFLTVFNPLFNPPAQAYPWMFFRENKEPEILKLDLHYSQFLYKKQSSYAGVQLNYHKTDIDINVGYQYSFLEKAHFLRLSELALNFPFIFKNLKINFGFKDVLWSEADRYFNQGFFQARYMVDAFRPFQMGLPGLYFNYQTDEQSNQGQSSFLLLVSYFYLPDIKAYPNQKQSQNPFLIEEYAQDLSQVNIDSFKIKRFLKPVVAFRLKHEIFKNSKISLSYAYKPMNQLQYAVLLNSEPKPIDLSQTDKPLDSENSFSFKNLKYSVLSHHLANLEWEAGLNDKFSLFGSLFYEKPEKKHYGTNWISDDFETHFTVSLLAYYKANLGEQSNTLFTLGWTKTMESQLQSDKSNQVTQSYQEELGRYFYWKEALSASIEYQSQEFWQGLLFRLRGNYALDNGFYSLAFENYIYFSPYIRAYLSGDLLLQSSNKAEDKVKNTSFIRKYKDLSRLLVGVQYVF